MRTAAKVIAVAAAALLGIMSGVATRDAFQKPVSARSDRLAVGRSSVGRAAPGLYRISYANAPGRSALTARDDLSVVVTVPAGWTSSASWIIEKGDGSAAGDVGPSFVVWTITKSFVDPCVDHRPRSLASGPGVDALIDALAGLPGMTASDVRDLTIGHRPARSIDLIVSADVADCPDGFWLWGDGDGYWSARVQGEAERVYVLDVDGQRRTFFVSVPPATRASDRIDLDAIVRSVEFVP